MRLLVVAGHGAGDPGAVGYEQEAEHVRALVNHMKDIGGNAVVYGDPSRNWYADSLLSTLDMSTFDAAIELQLDSGASSARGTLSSRASPTTTTTLWRPSWAGISPTGHRAS